MTYQENPKNLNRIPGRPHPSGRIPRDSDPIIPGPWAHPAPIEDEVYLPEGVIVRLADPDPETGEDIEAAPMALGELDPAEEPEELSDAWITLKVKGALAVHLDVSAFSTAVATDQGVVTLSGEADSLHERRKAALVAEGVKGVKRVDNRLQIFHDRFSA